METTGPGRLGDSPTGPRRVPPGRDPRLPRRRTLSASHAPGPAGLSPAEFSPQLGERFPALTVPVPGCPLRQTAGPLSPHGRHPCGERVRHHLLRPRPTPSPHPLQGPPRQAPRNPHLVLMFPKGFLPAPQASGEGGAEMGGTTYQPPFLSRSRSLYSTHRPDTKAWCDVFLRNPGKAQF